jgi:hypothetical protein
VAAVSAIPLENVLVAVGVLQRHVLEGQSVGDAGAEVRGVGGNPRVADDDGLTLARADERYVVWKAARSHRAKRALTGRRPIADVECSSGDHDRVTSCGC